MFYIVTSFASIILSILFICFGCQCSLLFYDPNNTANGCPAYIRDKDCKIVLANIYYKIHTHAHMFECYIHFNREIYQNSKLRKIFIKFKKNCEIILNFVFIIYSENLLENSIALVNMIYDVCISILIFRKLLRDKVS